MAKPELLHHPKFGRLLRELRAPAYVGVGILELLWQRCYAVSDDRIADAADLAWVVEWDRADAARLVDALVVAGFLDLDPDGGGYRVHNLWIHAPQYAARRRGHKAAFQTSSRTVPNHTDQKEQARSRLSHPVENVEPDLPFDGNGAQDDDDEHDQQLAGCSTGNGPDHREVAPPDLVRTAGTDRSGLLHRSGRSVTRIPEPINPRVLLRLTYELVGRRFESESDVLDAFKWTAAGYGIPYDGASAARALDRTQHTRGRPWVES